MQELAFQHVCNRFVASVGMIREAAGKLCGEVIENEERIKSFKVRIADDEFARGNREDFFD